MIKTSVKNIIVTLKNVPLFSNMDDRELLDFAVRYCSEKSFKSGGIVFPDKSGEKRLGIIGRGTAQIKNSNVVLGKLKVGDVFAADFVYSNYARYTNSISALSECKAVFVEKAGIDALISKSSYFAKKYIFYLSQNIASLNMKMEAYTSHTAEEKLLSYLMSEAKGNTVILNLKMTELSERLNVSRSSLYRVFDKLESGKRISRDGNKITLLQDI